VEKVLRWWDNGVPGGQVGNVEAHGEPVASMMTMTMMILSLMMISN